MTRERSGDYYALICAVVCALGNIPAKAALENLTPELFQLFFFGFGFLMSATYLVRFKARREVFSTTPKAFILIMILSVVFSLGIYTFISSLKLIEPATVSFLSRFEVLATLIFAFIFLKERLRPIEIIGGIITIGGIVILKFKTNLVISQAATLMILSALFFATAEIIIKKYINLIGTIRFIFWRNLFMIFIFYGFLIYQNQPFLLPGFRSLLLIAAAAFLLPVMGRITYIEALKRIKISRAALITQSTPLFTAIFALIILGTYPTPIEWLGGGLIIAGVVVIKLKVGRSKYNNNCT
ncbi:MAG TPA: DMT family transporter [candidate division Zixibacteria bacterium]|nr:DMT family transporter [candidate division Zixibacteria bacterium]